MRGLTLRDGGRLHYEVHSAGPPLLLVSGLGGLGASWQRTQRQRPLIIEKHDDNAVVYRHEATRIRRS